VQEGADTVEPQADDLLTPHLSFCATEESPMIVACIVLPVLSLIAADWLTTLLRHL
jgi:hypothetical protein